MKSLGRKTLRQKVEIETEKYMKENYEELAYHAICGQAPDITRQTVAMMLYAMSLNGYGTKRLNKAYEMFLSVLNMPKVFGKDLKCEDAMKMLAEKHGIDFSRINPHFQSYEEYARENR